MEEYVFVISDYDTVFLDSSCIFTRDEVLSNRNITEWFDCEELAIITNQTVIDWLYVAKPGDVYWHSPTDSIYDNYIIICTTRSQLFNVGVDNE